MGTSQTTGKCGFTLPFLPLSFPPSLPSFPNGGTGTQDRMLARQVLYYLNHMPSRVLPLTFFFFFFFLV
jgi:hypothetical protein